MKKLSFIPLLILLVVNIQCGGGGDRTHSGTTPVSIEVTEVTGGTETGSGADQLSGAVKTRDLASAVADGAGEGRQLSLCRFTITGPGMSDMVRDVDITGKPSISETFDVPSGVNRKILIQMYVANDDKAIYQASREGIHLEDVPVALDMKLEATADYFQPPVFEGVMSISNAESRSVKLSWKPAADNITPHDRIQYLVYLSTESIVGREDMAGEFINTYSLGKGSVLEGDPLMSYEYDGDELLLISYEYEGALPSEGDVIVQLDQGASSGRLETGMPYYFIVKAKDEWGHVEENLAESEEVVVYMLDVAVQGSGTVTSQPAGINCGEKCSEDYLRGTEVTLTAQADEEGAFESWTGNEQCGGAEVCNIIPDEDTPTITAKFCQIIRYFQDGDGDGYGDSAMYIDSCTEPDQDNYVELDEDCDDSNRAINPSAKEICGNDTDEDCDGIAEKDCDCNDGDTRTCGTDTGECVSGVESCVNREWSGVCVDEIGPSEEICDGKDNDCDGVPDGSENLTRTCGSTDVGECSYGTESCDDSGEWINCDAVYPSDEICTDNKDNDCDGNIDYADSADCKYSMSLSVNPSSPDANEAANVTVTITPAISTTVTMDVTGTDPYTQHNEMTTNSSGQATFPSIPGGASGITDTIVVEAPDLGLTETISFTYQ